MSDQIRAALARIDASAINDVRARRKPLWRMVSRLRLSPEQIDATPHRFGCLRAEGEGSSEECLFDLRVESDRGRRVEHPAVDVEMDRRLVVCRGHQDAAAGID